MICVTMANLEPRDRCTKRDATVLLQQIYEFPRTPYTCQILIPTDPELPHTHFDVLSQSPDNRSSTKGNLCA